MTPAAASLKGVDRPPAIKERATNTTSLDSRGPWTVVVGTPITVPAPASQILLHLRDCTRDGVSIIAQRRQQISSPDEFGNHLTGGRLEGANDLTHGTRQIFISDQLRPWAAIKRRSKARQRANNIARAGTLSFAGRA
jgi:hypothetical protein